MNTDQYVPRFSVILLGCLLTIAGCSDRITSAPVAKSRSKTTIDRVQSVAADLFGSKRSEITAETSLADLRADDLDFVELVMQLEEEFEVSIPDETAELLISTESWQEGMTAITMSKLAAVVDERIRAAKAESARPSSAEQRTIVRLTASAAEKIRTSQEHDGKPFLRISIVSNDTTGYSYDLKVDNEIDAANDYVDENKGIKVVVDKRSALFLEGVTIDWQTTSDGRQGFHFDNPNAVK